MTITRGEKGATFIIDNSVYNFDLFTKGNVVDSHYLYIYIIYSSFNCILTPEISTLFIVTIVPASTTEKYL